MNVLKTTLAALALIAINGIALAQPRAALAVWDTGKPSTEALSAATIDAKTGWKAISADDTKHTFQGDAVITNGRILAVARKHGNGVELYSLGSGQPIFRSRLLLTPVADGNSLTLTENSKATVGIELTSKSGAARFRLK